MVGDPIHFIRELSHGVPADLKQREQQVTRALQLRIALAITPVARTDVLAELPHPMRYVAV